MNNQLILSTTNKEQLKKIVLLNIIDRVNCLEKNLFSIEEAEK